LVVTSLLPARSSIAEVDLDQQGTQEPILIDDKPIDMDSLSLRFDKNRGLLLRVFAEDGAYERLVDAEALLDSNPKTGESMGGKNKNVKPAGKLDGWERSVCQSSNTLSDLLRSAPTVNSIDRKGSYGYAVTWSNGATFIYSMKVVVDLSQRPTNE